MEMITTPIAKGKYKYALFQCLYCNRQVEKITFLGKKGKSCGCVANELKAIAKIQHKDCNTSLYYRWVGINSRCKYKNSRNYKYYGGKGIKVCDEWTKYLPFKVWAIDNGYSDKLTIDRIDPDKNYEPSNCRWISGEENSRRAAIRRWTGKIIKIKGWREKR